MQGGGPSWEKKKAAKKCDKYFKDPSGEGQRKALR